MSLVGSYMGPQGSFCQPAGAIKWLCDLQRVNSELLPIDSISLAVIGVQLWVLPPPSPADKELADVVLAAV